MLPCVAVVGLCSSTMWHEVGLNGRTVLVFTSGESTSTIALEGI